MNIRLKYPLSLFIVWHPDFAEGKTIANHIYSIFCRDVNDPLSRGLGIPAYFRSSSLNKTPVPVDTTKAKRNAIILLIDIKYFIDDNFREYTQSLIQLVNDNTRLFPVALCEQAFDIGCGLSSYQFIRAFNGSLDLPGNLDFSIKKIKTEILHDCARLLMGMRSSCYDKNEDRPNSPIKLFLSHAKKDGLDTTIKFKKFVEDNLKLDVFFDTVDIADGYNFEKQIESNIKNSAFVVFHTDEYSAREWCRIEVLIAKMFIPNKVTPHS